MNKFPSVPYVLLVPFLACAMLAACGRPQSAPPQNVTVHSNVTLQSSPATPANQSPPESAMKREQLALEKEQVKIEATSGFLPSSDTLTIKGTAVGGSVLSGFLPSSDTLTIKGTVVGGSVLQVKADRVALEAKQADESDAKREDAARALERAQRDTDRAGRSVLGMVASMQDAYKREHGKFAGSAADLGGIPSSTHSVRLMGSANGWMCIVVPANRIGNTLTRDHTGNVTEKPTVEAIPVAFDPAAGSMPKDPGVMIGNPHYEKTTVPSRVETNPTQLDLQREARRYQLELQAARERNRKPTVVVITDP